jgi:hypothetical protein
MNLHYPYPRSLTVIREQNKLLGFRHRNRSYIIGFPKESHAKYMARHLTKENISRIYLLQHHIVDVTEDINAGLRAMDMSSVSVEGNVTIDLQSSLVLPKSKGHHHNDNLIDDISLDEFSFEDFLLLPFTRSVGITIPMSISDDTNTRLVFESQVIDPCEEPRMFKDYLSP